MKLAVLFMTALSIPLSAAAKAYLVSSIPGENAAINEAPTQLELRFNEEIKREYLAIAVTNSQGKRVNTTEINLNPTDPGMVYTALPKLTADTYTVRYRVMSIDTLLVNGSFSFTLSDPPPAPPVAPPPPPAPPKKR
jgi:methionine-rich copper-binding protein CopC